MTGSKKLMSALDSAAEKLLARHFPDIASNMTVIEPIDPEVQIKAFSAVVNYYGPRTKLGGDDERKESELGKLQRQLHGRGKARRNAGTAKGGANGAGEPGTQLTIAGTNGSGDPAAGSD
jgi:hypothetical protein